MNNPQSVSIILSWVALSSVSTEMICMQHDIARDKCNVFMPGIYMIQLVLFKRVIMSSWQSHAGEDFYLKAGKDQKTTLAARRWGNC